jgi:hypothetical protein
MMSVADPKCYVRLKEPISGMDHVKFIDRREFARAHGSIDAIAAQLGVDRINDFYVFSASSSSGPWYPASGGLASFRAVREFMEKNESPEYRASEAPTLDVLRKLEELLSEAASRGIDFCVVGNY